jgi:uncharacterized membrane protein YfcA
LALIILGNLIAALASASQAITGFGFALVLVPLLSFFLEPRLVVMISLSLGLACKAPLLATCWRDVQLDRIAALSLASMLGALGGTQILLRADPDVMRVAIGLIVIAFSIPLLFEMARPIGRERLATVVVGLVSGVINGATSMGGPPIVLFGVNQSWKKEQFRANLLGAFAISNTWTLVLLLASGNLAGEAFTLDLMYLPGLVVGVVVGSYLFGRIPAGPFRKAVVLLVIATGLVSIAQGIQKLMG